LACPTRGSCWATFITAQLTATTPVDREHSRLFDTITCTREPGSDAPEPVGTAARMPEFQKGQIRNDFRHLRVPAVLPGQTGQFAGCPHRAQAGHPVGGHRHGDDRDEFALLVYE
jgi:hypothetical protein